MKPLMQVFSRKKAAALGSLLFLLLPFAPGARAGDLPATHGMLVVGGKSIYFSHLPMFHQPHDYQVILQVDLGVEGNGAYFADKAAHPEMEVYTFVPRPMVLPEVVAGKKTFSGDLYRGHFERGGTPIRSGLSVEIRKVLHFRKFDPQANRPDLATYLLFGESGDLWLAHLISTKPDFDQLASVSLDGFKPPAGGAEQIRVPGAGADRPLADGQDYLAQEERGSVTLQKLHTTYLEFGDLSD